MSFHSADRLKASFMLKIESGFQYGETGQPLRPYIQRSISVPVFPPSVNWWRWNIHTSVSFNDHELNELSLTYKTGRTDMNALWESW
ncbi:hypothetical protein M513_05446 [Trichuris suis]|uniref:Uncharacterized protein n=1 Tax=Trichuris suis TaxID=68888 RepID=A0A085M945_9BILA|nr:hypothetical protein M513_05446 [Trichuris suis]